MADEDAGPVSRGAVKGVAVLGSTGSIGRNTLEVVRRHPERFRVVALSAGANTAALAAQVEEFRPAFVSALTEGAALEIRRNASYGVTVGFGQAGAAEAASYDGVDVTVSSISGSAGLLPTLAAIEAGKDVALANKEALVMAGPLVMRSVREKGVRLLPVDSEHSAVFQALSGHRVEDVRRIILTASGGPFLNAALERLDGVTPDEALMHPNWSMGRKVTVDSATLMNKGLEVIEARWLFDMPPEKIAVSIHPQSIVHSMVEYMDGSIVAQMGRPDMKGPIAYALSYPERIEGAAPPLDLNGLRLDFMEPDPARFPCLGLAYEALVAGGTAPAAVNAADEAAVNAFLEGRLAFTGIHRVIKRVFDRHRPSAVSSVEDVLEADRWARAEAEACIRLIAV
jgi:1-deoxy-D-xylulose-5-phosphate reductoisomerase